jgi:UDP-N-acetylglucosamine--N-acetylmuramyl-(pentapeptide) pyrophosphoryl-undecaprenol N-acetylglucosamine transferase
VAQALRGPGQDGDVVVVGRRGGVAERLVTEAGIHLETLDISGVDVTNPRSVARALVQLPSATIAARSLLRSTQPDVVVGAGGYVCVPVVMAAWARGVPVVLMEQNAYPGRATRMLARRAYAVAASFAQTERALPGAHVVVTGNPVRSEVIAKRGAPLSEWCQRVLVTGGSQGARRLNQAMLGCARELLEAHGDLTIAHQCGALDAAVVQASAEELPAAIAARYRVAPFFDDLPAEIAASDLVIMRAGGSSLAECTALGRPMMLVPYPHAAGHQAYNAVPYVRAGAGLLIEDEDCTPERLRLEVDALIRDRARWSAMAAASAAMGTPDAAARVVELINEAGAHAPRRRAA